MNLAPEADESLDVLSRTLRILQRRRGHRAASDDVVLAGVAVGAHPSPSRILDLGTGKGTVALLLLRRIPEAVAVGLEVYPESHALAVRNAALNGLDQRFSPQLADLREADALSGEGAFDLITGAPPFMPVGTGVLPTDPQRAAGRFELRGGIEDYALTAARALAPQGRVVLLMDGANEARTRSAFAAAGLALHARVGVSPRPGRPEVYWVFVGGLEPGLDALTLWSMRGAAGEAWSPEYAALRRHLDLP